MTLRVKRVRPSLAPLSTRPMPLALDPIAHISRRVPRRAHASQTNFPHSQFSYNPKTEFFPAPMTHNVGNSKPYATLLANNGL